MRATRANWVVLLYDTYTKEGIMARTLKEVTRKNARTLADIRSIRGFDRAAHFAAGGTLEAWRGRADVRPDKRKESNRRACRGMVEED